MSKNSNDVQVMPKNFEPESINYGKWEQRFEEIKEAGGSWCLLKEGTPIEVASKKQAAKKALTRMDNGDSFELVTGKGDSEGTSKLYCRYVSSSNGKPKAKKKKEATPENS